MTVPSSGPHVSASEFRALMSRFASGVTIVSTVDHDGTPHGMTVSAFSSLSMDPPLVLVCIDAAATMCEVLTRASHFAVSFLAEEQREISRRFSDTAMERRFEGVATSAGSGGVPVIDNAHAVVECRRVATHPGGDHLIVVGEVIAGNQGTGTAPLLYHRGGYGRLER